MLKKNRAQEIKQTKLAGGLIQETIFLIDETVLSYQKTVFLHHKTVVDQERRYPNPFSKLWTVVNILFTFT